MSLAICIIASEKRKDTTLSAVVDSVAWKEPDEALVVADFEMPHQWRNVRWLTVAPMLHNTIDALVKRDVGWAATTSDTVMFLCDDHRLGSQFVLNYRKRYADGDWDILCPSRFTDRGEQRIPLNVGQLEGYVGGHAGIYRRHCGNLLPWSAGPHHRNWDLLHSHALVAKGAKLQYADTDLAVEDIEGGTPWL